MASYRGNLRKQFVLFVVLLSLTLLTWTFFTSSDVTNRQEYAKNLVKDSTTVLSNSVTDDENDFFVLTSNDEVYYITVTGHRNKYEHTMVVVADDNVQLNDMRKVSIAHEKAHRKPAITYMMPIILR